MPHLEFKSGALPDTRTEEEKKGDIQFREIVATIAPVNWTEKPTHQWRRFPIFNQDGSGSCVAQTLAKMIGILYWLINGIYVHFSATDCYQRRSNKPQPGMIGNNAFEIGKEGITLEELVPSQGLTDQQMDGIQIPPYKREVGKIFRIGEPIIGPVKDIDAIASIIQQTGKGVMVWFYFKLNEWTDVPFIDDPNLNPDTAPGRHSVCAVDFTLYQGKKALIIEDSWGTSYGMAGQRIITEDFFRARNIYVAHIMNFKFDEVIPKPKHTFTKTLKYGMTDPDVKALQDILKYENLFPTNVASTGYYGSLTAKGVLGWQKNHKVASDQELDALKGESFGPKSITKANQLYS